ncbi:MAG: ABC transporter substrate-binding protein [Betaproteobacteria bacterium]|nr:ABC transporter substrate-binding protein [Betaproteobacteria bacterium]
MNRRETLISLVALGAAVGPLGARAQQPAKPYRVGFLSLLPRQQAASHIKALQEGLRGLGYIEGRNIVLEYRFADGKADRLSDLVAELIRLKVDVIVTGFGTLPALAAKKATSTIPVVFSFVSDPVEAEVVASLAHPGGNITGLSTVAAGLAAKRLQLLKEILPRLSRVAILLNPATPAATQALSETKAAAEKLAIQLHPLEAWAAQDIESSFAAARERRAEALIAVTDPLTIAQRARILEFADKSRLPTMYGMRDFAETGGLVSYGANYDEPSRRAAVYVDKILKGARPADLPVEQPTAFELVINMKTAKALGLTIPQSLLLRADRVIE